MANFVLASRHPIVLIITSDGVAASPNDIVKRILGAEVRVCSTSRLQCLAFLRMKRTKKILILSFLFIFITTLHLRWCVHPLQLK